MTMGPWKVYDGPQISPIFSGIVCMISASDKLIAVITEDEAPVDPSTWGDIARLLSAAPAMLAALNGIRAHRPDYADNAWDAVDEAISKAEGK